MPPPKRKPVPEAKMIYTLRDFNVDDWRWKVPEGTKLYMRRRAGAGLPSEMREALEKTRDKTGLSMAEIIRRCLRKNIMSQVWQRTV